MATSESPISAGFAGLVNACSEPAFSCPRLQMGKFPTPVAPLANLGHPGLWIKRDDLTSDCYGGNKVRKLEFLLADARRRGSRHLITVGGIGTNHGLAASIHCHRLGLRCILLLYRQPVTAAVRQNLKLFAYYGAVMSYRATLLRAMTAYYLHMRLRYPRGYFVYPGGSDPLGTVGYVSAAYELKAQVEQGHMPAPAVIVCPFGSGGTLAGLALGAQLAGLTAEIVGVRVIASHLGPIAAATTATVLRLMRRTLALLRRNDRRVPDIPIRPPRVLDRYFGRGYGVPTEAGRRALRQLQRFEGIALDPTYTAKTVAAVFDICRERRDSKGPVLYWHTYNSVDLSPKAAAVTPDRLPPAFRPFLCGNQVEEA